jgi:DNA-binding transcriptional regulator YiaG
MKISSTYLLDEDNELIRSGLIKQMMNPTGIKQIRQRYGMTQVKFAALLSLSYDTLRSWEGGYRFPSSPGYALLLIAEKSPETFVKNRKQILKTVAAYKETIS